MTRITNKGICLILSTLVILLFGIILSDLFLMFVTLMGVAFIAYEYQQVRKLMQMARNITISPTSMSLTGIAGEIIKEKIIIYSPAHYTLTTRLQCLEPKNVDLGIGENYVELIYSPVLGGIKHLKEITLEATDSYSTFSSTIHLEIDYTFTTYPRVFPIAAQAMSYLSKMSTLDETIYSHFRGSGTEYAETREYQPGDPLRKFDWKAYAKTTRPMVKDYYIEEGGGTTIIYDNASDNPISLEELNHTFLKTVLSFTEREENIQVKTLTDEGLLSYELNRFNTLLLSIQIVLEGNIQEFIQYYALLDPKNSGKILSNIIQDKQIPLATINPEFTNAIIISSMVRNPILLLQVIEDFNYRNVSLINPTKTWVWQKTLEKTYQSYKYNMKISSILQKRGVEIYTSHDKILSSYIFF